jgi:MerR family redox-sensitive transcriptional activator SoxR
VDQFAIGEVAQRAGVNASTLRYYERIGLLEKPDRVSGQRRYTAEVLVRLALIRMAQEAGFSIEEIRTLLSGYPEETRPAERWQELAERKLPEVDAMIRRMATVRQVLQESLACDCLTLDACAHEGWQTTRNERAQNRGAGEMFTWMHR